MRFPSILLTVLFAMGAMGQGQRPPKSSTLAELKKESRIFEQIIREVLRQNFDNPFALAAEPKAAYVPGHGIVLSFHLKINRGTIRAFYGPIINPVSGPPQSASEQLTTVKNTMIQALADYGDTLKGLPSGEQLSICAHVEDRNELDTAKNRTDIVLSIEKKDVEAYTRDRIDFEEFKRRVRLIEY
jgi:hypothetical protein